MRKTTAFVMVKELCGDAIFLANASPQELCINAAFECIDSGISIIGYFMVKKNAKERMKAEDVKIAAEEETYCIKLRQETEEMRQKFAAARDFVNKQAEKSHVLMETIQGVTRILKEMSEYLNKKKKALSRTEEDIRQNKQQLESLNDWFIKYIKNYKDLLEYYQIGDDEDG